MMREVTEKKEGVKEEEVGIEKTEILYFFVNLSPTYSI